MNADGCLAVGCIAVGHLDTLPVQLTPEIPARTASSDTEVFFDQTFTPSWSGTGSVLLASDPAGTSGINVDDRVILDVTAGSDGITRSFDQTAGWPAVVNVTSLFRAGPNTVRLRLVNVHPTQVAATAIWLV